MDKKDVILDEMMKCELMVDMLCIENNECRDI
jgi:hypothetical protein